jgi:hypothetical protein
LVQPQQFLGRVFHHPHLAGRNKDDAPPIAKITANAIRANNSEEQAREYPGNILDYQRHRSGL